MTEISECTEGLRPFLPVVPLSWGREGWSCRMRQDLPGVSGGGVEFERSSPLFTLCSLRYFPPPPWAYKGREGRRLFQQK